MTHSNSFSRRSSSGNVSTSESVFPAESMAEGYFKAFFREEYRLGMGANGSVFLCQVRLFVYCFLLGRKEDDEWDAYSMC